MQPKNWTYVLLIPLSLASVFAIGFLLGEAIGSIVAGTICLFQECCSKNSIIANFDGLENALYEHVYGQPLAQDIVVNSIRSHWNGIKHPQKALTLSFHGWPGGGKNYVTKFIIENLYEYGSKSKFVHHFVGRVHFPNANKVQEYRDDLQSWIKGNTSRCGKQMFIFDEVDKIPANLLDMIKPMIDYRDDVDGVDYRNCIFIFLSNTGGNLINEYYLDMWFQGGTRRDDLKLKDFEPLIRRGAFNEEGGYKNSDTIRSNLIDHYVPFLPLERRHVKMCIIDEFKQRKVKKPEEEYINEVMEFIEWGPKKEQLFSTTGCKRISKKVGAIVSKYRLYGRN